MERFTTKKARGIDTDSGGNWMQMAGSVKGDEGKWENGLEKDGIR